MLSLKLDVERLSVMIVCEKCYYNHRQSFKNHFHAIDKSLFKYIWEMKSNNHTTQKLIWYIAKSVPSYSNILKKCPLCLHKKYNIVSYPKPKELLNSYHFFIFLVLGFWMHTIWIIFRPTLKSFSFPIHWLGEIKKSWAAHR